MKTENGKLANETENGKLATIEIRNGGSRMNEHERTVFDMQKTFMHIVALVIVFLIGSALIPPEPIELVLNTNGEYFELVQDENGVEKKNPLTASIASIADYSNRELVLEDKRWDGKDRNVQFINKYKGKAQEVADKLGVSAAFVMAQAVHETGFGGLGTEKNPSLFARSNNIFNIKCWKDKCLPGMYELAYDDDVDENGKDKKSKFFKFASPEDSFDMYFEFMSKPNYRLKMAKCDKSDWDCHCRQAKIAGYATDPSYVSKLSSHIRKWRLHELDKNYKKVTWKSN